MKWILTSLLTCVFTVSFGQHQPVEFPDSGASIMYIIITTSVGVCSTDLVTYTHVRDTIGYDKIEGKNKRIMILKSNDREIYIHKDSTGRIQYGYENRGFYFYDMVDFNSKVGDYHKGIRSGKITKIDTIKSQGIQRRRAFLNYSKDLSYIEGIGSTDGAPLFFVHGFTEKAELLCFSVNDTVTYINPKYKTCDTSWHTDLAVQNPMQNRMVMVQGKNLIIKNIENSVENVHLQIHDLNGKLVNSFILSNKGTSTLPMNLNDGFYLYSLLSNEQILERGKIILK